VDGVQQVQPRLPFKDSVHLFAHYNVSNSDISITILPIFVNVLIFAVVI